MAEHGYKLLEVIERITGQNDLGERRWRALQNGSQFFVNAVLALAAGLQPLLK
jgi:hypothetical protein